MQAYSDQENPRQCLSHLPHDDTLTPTVKPDDIVAVNKSGSYYDGMALIFNSLWRYLMLNSLRHRVHTYGLKPRRKPEPSRSCHSLGRTRSLYEQIHFTGLFLPWHRWYVHSLESALKSKCGFTGATPYWNWSSGEFLRLTRHF
jgi:tyrosinase